MLKAGHSVAYRRNVKSILALNQQLGDTRVAFEVGQFEVWHSKSVSMWDAKLKRRVVRPAVYRIVKRTRPGRTLLAGKFIACQYVFVMRAEEVDGEHWRLVRDAFIAQAILLFARERKRGQQ